jgi:hypothetical protein
MKLKEKGRPPGAANVKSRFVRDQVINARVSEGFLQCLEEMASMDGVSKADVLHEALLQFAYRHRTSPKLKAWTKKIV